ncbi:MAG: CvpA family protein [Gammaproteobacteria bacterium]|nr:CvpA family protein [Gammaproteobacteria bacterium]
MTWIDFVIIGVIFISCFISLIRGFVREALSLTAWIVSFVIAWRLHGSFSTFLQGSIENLNLRLIVAFFTLFTLSMVMFAVVNFFACKIVQRTGLSGADRAIGILFGFLRGVVLVSALVALAGLTQIPKAEVWQHSYLVGKFQAVAIWLTGFLPGDVARNFVF